MTQAVVLSTGFSSFHLADIDSGRNVFIVGFSIFMALLLPRWLQEAPVLLSTGGRRGEGRWSCSVAGKQGLELQALWTPGPTPVSGLWCKQLAPWDTKVPPDVTV